jgi:hypothetical protein
MNDELADRAADMYRGNGGAAALATEIARRSAQMADQKAKEARERVRRSKALEAA